MGIIVNIGEEKSDLQKRIAADLREKQEKKSSGEGKKPRFDADFAKPEFDVDKSEYMKDFAKSSIPGWVWAFGLIFAIIIAAVIASAISGGLK